MNETADLTRFLSRLSFDDLSEDAIVMGKLAIVDAIGNALFSRDLEWSSIVAQFARDVGGGGQSVLWGSGTLVSAPYAALSNGTAVHGIEMDDRHHTLQIHNGAATIPAAIAIAEQEGRSGRDLIVSVVAGYEAAFRVARATKRTIDRFYWVSIRSIFGATAAAGRMLGLSPDQMLSAFGIAGSMASGLWEVKNDPRGTMIKRVQGGGWPSYCGTTAAMLAARGFTGPSQVLEGEHGVCRAFSSTEPYIDELTEGLGEDLQILHWETKPYASWGGAHSSIEAAISLREEHLIDSEDIVRISVGCSEETHWHSGVREPQSIMAAQTSLTFLVAATFYFDLRDPSSWSQDILTYEPLRSLCSMTDVYRDDELDEITKRTKSYAGAKVSITMKDESTYSKWVQHAKGTPGNPLSSDEVRDKFRLLAGQVLSSTQVEELDRYLWSLEDEFGRFNAWDHASVHAPV